MKRIIILMMIGLLLMTACQNTQDQTTVESPYQGGSKGLSVTFEPFGVEEEGVATIFDDETFPVEITLLNQGEEDIEAGDVSIELKGISPSDFSGLDFDGTNTETLDKVSEFNPRGGEETVDLGDASYDIALAGSYYDATVFATYIYPYQTHVAVPRVCFSTDPRDTSICVLEGDKKVFSSGAPVQVLSSKETRAGANLIAVEFEVENVGGGQVTKPGEDFDTRYGQLSFELDDTSNPGDWECRLGGEENGGRLIDGKGTIRCKLKNPLEDDTLYIKELDLTISYDYKDSIDQTVRIKKKD